MALVTFANGETQTCFPSKESIGLAVGIKKSTVYEGIKELKDAGVIDINIRENDKKQTSNEYVLLPIPFRNTEEAVCNTNPPPSVLQTPPVRNTNPNKKKLNKKNINETSLPKDKPSVDEPSLHTLFRNDYGAYFEHKNKCPAPWDAKEASRLKKWMQSNPTITRDKWRAILTNRARSPVGHAKALSVWIGVAVGWLNGPADDWGKAMVNGGTNGAVPRGKTDQNLAILAASIERGKRKSGSDEDGLFSTGAGGFGGATGVVHPSLSRLRLAGVSSGDGKAE